MSSSSRIKKNKSKVSLGDLDTLCDIYYRRQKAPKDVKFELSMELISPNTWVCWDVIKGVELFDDNNQSIGIATEIIKMHYDERYGNFKYINCNGRWYEVLQVKVMNRRDNFFMTLFAVEKGIEDNKVSIL